MNYPVRQSPGLYAAVVHNNVDPQGKNRVQLKIPQILGSQAVSPWAEPMGLAQAAPPVGTIVHAQFLGGDPAKPVYSMRTQTATGGNANPGLVQLVPLSTGSGVDFEGIYSAYFSYSIL